MLTLSGRKQAHANRRTIEALHDGIMAAARRPAFYLDYGVADTFEGRFEILALLAGLALRRLNAMAAPGPEVAQRLVDALFRRLDPALREMGVGDFAVPKRMKRLAGDFLGRNAAYDAALRQDGSGLAAALSRNVLGAEAGGERLARYTMAAARAIEATPAEDLLRGSLRFPDPASVA
ncbi:MAG TPA: ubiquinol-cytochrome C chaperone family protein [Lichenihabitans sp.]|jgi:cytochrome b pre-mRNA-processing protein 3|nr:ubiquinol-cytochrome C chaperone family protein [Lichenihabitans sp.]